MYTQPGLWFAPWWESAERDRRSSTSANYITSLAGTDAAIRGRCVFTMALCRIFFIFCLINVYFRDTTSARPSQVQHPQNVACLPHHLSAKALFQNIHQSSDLPKTVYFYSTVSLKTSEENPCKNPCKYSNKNPWKNPCLFQRNCFPTGNK